MEEYEENKLFTPAFTRLDVSPINGTVSFNHAPDISIRSLIAELEDAGFDIVKTDATDLERNDARRLHAPTAIRSRWARFSDLFTFTRDKEQAHRDNCEACREEEEARAHREQHGSRAASPSHDIRDADHQERRGRDPTVQPKRQLVEAIFAIDGMTCACVIASSILAASLTDC